jgi:lantibiotic modifying enzyme
MKRKIINLSEVCPQVMEELERLHYEVVTKERIIALAITSNTSAVSSKTIENYYKDYMKVFKEYENIKLNLYNDYIAAENPDGEYISWEADFTTQSVILHD